ncbi:Imm53 family immunity protein [Nonomuraea sp. NPDC050451]|uniref:Imm53 family immunity protein n=1 Tax=Nonomuraea sp. NPDC050451 TaxID=3364364 RepID=UPI00379E6AD6
MSALAFLQSWCSSCCDDGWEHTYGGTISTLDNPGWRLKIDLADTPLDRSGSRGGGAYRE